MRKGSTVKLSEVVERLAKRYGFERELKLWKIRKVWVEKFGKFSRFVMPGDYKRKVLYLYTESPVWKTELNYLKEEILKSLSESLELPIKNIVIKVAPLDEER